MSFELWVKETFGFLPGWLSDNDYECFYQHYIYIASKYFPYFLR